MCKWERWGLNSTSRELGDIQKEQRAETSLGLHCEGKEQAEPGEFCCNPGNLWLAGLRVRLKEGVCPIMTSGAEEKFLYKSFVSDLLHYVCLSSCAPVRQLLEISAPGVLGTVTKRLTYLLLGWFRLTHLKIWPSSDSHHTILNKTFSWSVISKCVRMRLVLSNKTDNLMPALCSHLMPQLARHSSL